eukprot:6187709-Pleurochrysis_carterae.AAC.4
MAMAAAERACAGYLVTRQSARARVLTEIPRSHDYGEHRGKFASMHIWRPLASACPSAAIP